MCVPEAEAREFLSVLGVCVYEGGISNSRGVEPYCRNLFWT